MTPQKLYMTPQIGSQGSCIICGFRRIGLSELRAAAAAARNLKLDVGEREVELPTRAARCPGSP